MFLIDTNVISELRKAKWGRASRNVVAWAKSIPAENLFTSVMVIQELEIGALRAARRDPAQGDALRAWLDDQIVPSFSDRILPIDMAVARRGAALHVPDPRPIRDSLIAATALVYGMTVATRNIADFAVTGVALVNPWDHAP